MSPDEFALSLASFSLPALAFFAGIKIRSAAYALVIVSVHEEIITKKRHEDDAAPVPLSCHFIYAKR